MSRRNRLLVLVIVIPILSIAGGLIIPPLLPGDQSDDFLGFRLSQPVLALTAAEFPDPDIGISGYLKFAPGSIDLDELPRTRFDNLTHAGDNFVIGDFLVSRNRGALPGVSTADRSFIRVHLYADSQGWLMAYLRKDALTAEIIHRAEAQELATIQTVLHRAMVEAAPQAGVDITKDSDITYFHWAYPTATHLALTRKDGDGNLYFAIPLEATTFDVSAATTCRAGSDDPVVFNQGHADKCAEAGPYGILSVPLMNSLPPGRSIDTAGNVVAQNNTIPVELGASGPSPGEVHAHNLTQTNDSSLVGPFWDGFAFLYSMP